MAFGSLPGGQPLPWCGAWRRTAAVLSAAVALAATRVAGGADYYYYSEAAEAPATTYSTSSDPLADGGCPNQHVELIDGSCERSWRSDPLMEGVQAMAVKPVNMVRKLCAVPTESLRRLQDLVARLPADAWKMPNARFIDKGQNLEYTQVAFHFPRWRRGTDYLIYPLATEVHSWIEPILLNITARYNYSREPLPQAPGYLRTSIPRLILARLEPGMRQKLHADRGSSSHQPHKIHVPLTDGSQAFLHIRDILGSKVTVPHEMDLGYAYEVNNLYPHCAENQGDEARVHLIFEFAPLDVGSAETDEESPLTIDQVDDEKAKRMSGLTITKRRAQRQHKRRQRSQLKAQMKRDHAEFEQARKRGAEL